jgi:hypothetical protein
MRTAKSCGSDASTLASSSSEAGFLRDDGDKKPDRREDHEVNRNTTARGMPGDSGVTVVTNARVFYTTRAAAGASGARHSLRPLKAKGGMFSVKLARKMRRDREAVSERGGMFES